MELHEWLPTKLGQDIWEKKYKFENETLDQFFDRVSGGNENIRKLIIEKKFLFGGRILANRGLQKLGKKITMSNCYVISPPEDNLESIFDCASKLARTYSYGGGCGIDISRLSPKGAKINNAAKETSGSVSFMTLYSLVTELIGQSGRRGALMISIDCDHPDLIDFIKIKSDLNKVTKANISIKITDDFMNAVKEDRNWMLTYVREETYERIDIKVSAREVFELLCKMNWEMAEPGILYWDRIKGWNLLSEDDNFEYAGVNPCAEEPLPAGGSCLLGSINLSEFIINTFTESASFDYKEFLYAVKQGVIGLNEVLHEGLELHPLEEQRDSVNNWRQIGLGLFGWHDALIKLGIKYGSEKSLELANDIGRNMINEAIITSSNLVDIYDVYPMCSIYSILNSPFFIDNTSNPTKELVVRKGLANSQLLTIPPTGSLATMLGVSTALEPIYNIAYTRKTESLHGKDEYYKVYTPIVEEYMNRFNITDETDLPDYFNTAMTIDFKDRIDMQATWQTYIDASISSTVNVPNSFTIDEIEELYLYAWQQGLKGVTIYRDGCSREGILATSTNNINDNNDITSLKWGTVIESSDDLIGRKRKLISGCGSLHCTAFFDPIDGRLMETYLSKGSTGGCNNFMVGLSRMISFAARHGADIYGIVDQLNSCGVCPSYAVRKAKYNDVSNGACCPVAVGKALLDMHNEIIDDLGLNDDVVDINDYEEIKCNECPECGCELKHEGGCISCVCGYSKCS